jgi:hypothetical protein
MKKIGDGTRIDDLEFRVNRVESAQSLRDYESARKQTFLLDVALWASIAFLVFVIVRKEFFRNG